MSLVLVLFYERVSKEVREALLRESGNAWALVFDDNDRLYGIQVPIDQADALKHSLLQFSEVAWCERAKSARLISDVSA